MKYIQKQVWLQILTYLYRNGGSTATTLSKELDITFGHVHKIIKFLIDLGLVKKCDSKYKKPCYITDKGFHLIDKSLIYIHFIESDGEVING